MLLDQSLDLNHVTHDLPILHAVRPESTVLYENVGTEVVLAAKDHFFLVKLPNDEHLYRVRKVICQVAIVLVLKLYEEVVLLEHSEGLLGNLACVLAVPQVEVHRPIRQLAVKLFGGPLG